MEHRTCWCWSSNTHQQDESQTHLTHCHVHALQLAVGDIIKATNIMRGTLDTAFELNKLIKYSMV